MQAYELGYILNESWYQKLVSKVCFCFQGESNIMVYWFHFGWNKNYGCLQSFPFAAPNLGRIVGHFLFGQGGRGIGKRGVRLGSERGWRTITANHAWEWRSSIFSSSGWQNLAGFGVTQKILSSDAYLLICVDYQNRNTKRGLHGNIVFLYSCMLSFF